MPAQLESDFIAHSGSLLNYVLVTCLLGLISLFARLIFAASWLLQSLMPCRVVKGGQGGPLKLW